jgi:DNA-binding protein H-NS
MRKKLNFDAMSIDEMWQLHERIIEILSSRLASEKRELEKRLAKLHQEKHMPRPDFPDQQIKEPSKGRRRYPRVFPRYRNPEDASETWSGRGKRPRWLAAALTSGRKIEDFKIADVESNGAADRRQRS